MILQFYEYWTMLITKKLLTNSYNFLQGGMSHWQQTIWSLCWSGSWNFFWNFLLLYKRTSCKSFCEISCLAEVCYLWIFLVFVITSRMPRSGKLPVLNLLRPKIRFCACRGDSLHRFTPNLARPTGTGVRLPVQNFTSIATGLGMRPPKYQKFPLFGK